MLENKIIDLIVGHLEKYTKFIINTNIEIKNEMKKKTIFSNTFDSILYDITKLFDKTKLFYN